MPCSRSWGGGIPACLAVFQAHTQGEVVGDLAGGSPGPHTREKLRGIWQGGLQAHTQGGSCGGSARGVSRPTPKGEVVGDQVRGVSRPTPKGEVVGDQVRGVSRPRPGRGAWSQGDLLGGGGVDGYCCGLYASYWNAFLL